MENRDRQEDDVLDNVQDLVRDYYGEQLKSSDDLKTSACCDLSSTPEWLKPLLANIHPEILNRYYGCGLVAPSLLEGARILDLGCGTGRDVYALAQLAGPAGQVVGVDMTENQLQLAMEHREWHARRFGFDNVTFIHGDIEKLSNLDLAPASFDIIISNCVVNLVANKQAVLAGAHHLLKPGGEFYFSDVYAERRVPRALKADPILYGECLGGALYWGDFMRLCRTTDFLDPRLVESRPLSITSPELSAKIGALRFYSATYRLFNIAELEDACEDYGQAVIYRGSVPHAPDAFCLDQHHVMETGRVFPVCGNSWRMLAETRFAPHFTFMGDFSSHYGIFSGCGTSMPFTREDPQTTNGACC